ncbi:hypothetical protein OKW49_001030 [Paraburkholderia youngii]
MPNPTASADIKLAASTGATAAGSLILGRPFST